jgi:hypothetical protein
VDIAALHSPAPVSLIELSWRAGIERRVVPTPLH